MSFSFANYGNFRPGAAGLTATGNSQATSLPLPAQINLFSSVPTGAGCMLPQAHGSNTLEISVLNRDTFSLLVYPPVGGQIETLGVNAPYSIPAGTSARFQCFDPPMAPGQHWTAFTELGLSSPGPYLPLTGGVVSGATTFLAPVNLTATGGTVSRSEQDRWADIANVLDFGADPTGVADSTAAFKAAIAARNQVFIPAGNYTLSDAVTLGPATTIYGAGMQTTLLTIQSSFNMSALGVFVFGGSGAGFPAIRDLWIRFTQPNFSTMTRSDLIQYPPALYHGAAPTGGRPVITNVQITSAWIGLYMDNCAASINTLMMSALHQGIVWSPTTPTLDAVRLNDLHFWGFDLPTYVQPLFMDGTTQCAWFGRIDSLFVENFFSESSIVTVDNTASPSGGYYFFQTIGLDGPAQLIINGAVVCSIDQLFNSRSATPTTPSLTVNGGRVALANSSFSSSMTATSCVLVTGGGVQISGGPPWFKEGAGAEMVTVSGGACYLNNVNFGTHTGTHTAPFVHQSGTAVLVVNNCSFGPSGTNGVAVQMDTVVAGNFIGVSNVFTTLTTAGAGLMAIPTVRAQSITAQTTPTSTSAPLVVMGGGLPGQLTNAAEAKERFFATFLSGTDYVPHMVSSFRSGWTGTTWNTSYLDVWLTGTPNTTADDANTTQIARFSNGGLNVYSQAGVNPQIALSGPNQTYRTLAFQTAGVVRWGIQVINGNETGSNVGSDLVINNYSDAGGALGPIVRMIRATGAMVLPVLQASASYANDAAAATGGVALGQLYRNGSAVQIRVT